MKRYLNLLLLIVYALFIAIALLLDFQPGKDIGFNFLTFAISMLKILPAAFIIIGLFEVWVPKEIIERHLGEKSRFIAYFWIILLAGTTVGGMYVALPVSASLYKKGARLSVVFAYLTSAAVFRIPMAIFEASFLGVKFTILRFIIALPMIILSSEILGRYIERSVSREQLYKND